MNKRRVVVTGLGAVTPLGNTVTQTWDAILQSKSGVRTIHLFDASHLSTQINAEVRDFDISPIMEAKEARRTDLFVQFAAVAAQEALEDSGFVSTPENAYRVGVAVGAGIGGLPWIEKTHETLLELGPRKITPFFIPGAIINMAPGLISIKHSLKGPNLSIVTACTTGTHNVGAAARIIAYGDADVMVAGGTEMATSSLGIGGFASARALSTRNDAPEKASRPWDKDRDGFVMGEGAGILVLEELEHAQQRGAHIYAELVGYGTSADAHHMTSPAEDGRGGQMSMLNALRDARLELEQVDYINAHGTSTPTGDVIEALAIKNTFGAHAYKLAVSSTKSMTGHLLGAAGAVEAIFSVLAIRDQVAPPTINLDNPDEGCDLDFVPHVASSMKVDVVLSNSFGFGGTNGSLVFKRM